jgi:D-arginine dehydrogenase
MGEYDFIVIGAGIAGMSLACELSAKGRTLLLEMESQPGYHSTGRSAAYYAPAYGNDVVREITVASGAFFYEPPAGFTDHPLVNNRPALFVATKQQQQSLQNTLNASSHLELIDRDAIESSIPIIDKGIITQGAIDYTGGDLDVDGLMQGYQRLFKQRKGEISTNSTVVALQKSSAFWRVTTTNDSYQAKTVVNAAGAWADQIAILAGIKPLLLQPKRRTAMLVDTPLHLNSTDWPMVIDVDEQFYLKPDAGQILLSPADETLSEACDTHPEEFDIAVAIDRIQRICSLPVEKVNHSWAGLRTFATDNTFVSGFDTSCEGFYWQAGQGGYGVQSCAGMADIGCFQITGDCGLMSEQRIKKLADKLSPARFS